VETGLRAAHHFPLAQQPAARLVVLVVEGGQRGSAVGVHFRLFQKTGVRPIILGAVLVGVHHPVAVGVGPGGGQLTQRIVGEPLRAGPWPRDIL